jgi:hypothetical protein
MRIPQRSAACMSSSATLLAQVESAITALLDGNVQSYKVDGQEYTLLDLAELRRMRTQLQREVSTQARRKKRGMFGRVRWGQS